MKKLVVLTAILLLLAGAGAGGWFYYLRPLPADDTRKPPPVFVTLPLMSVPVIEDDRINRTVALQITLELGSPEFRSSVERAMPHLVNAYLIELHALLPRRLMQERGSDLELMKYRLVDVAERVLGQRQVTDVLIKMLGERRRG